MVGQTLGHYKILEKVGEGGMGEVYRAEDTTLKRQVALKVLPAGLASSQERLVRFQREAETLAALDHPNIVTIYTVEEAEGFHFLTMQLVKGRRLSELLAADGMSLQRVLEIAVPLADALADAHEHGVIHRDLKPGNIMVTNEGRVKILDFGLAKLKQAPESGMVSQLRTEPLTEEGRLLGTAPYMSPEQVEGRPLDSRSDIFSLGIVMYEMASGRRPFNGKSSTSTMARILESEPEQLSEVKPDLPPEFLRIVRRCLRKEPEHRYNDTRDLLVALKDLRQDSSSQYSGYVSRETLARPTTRRLRWTAWGISVAVAGVAVVTGWVLLRRPAESPRASPAPVRHSQITFSGDATHPEISPDGGFVAYVAKNEIVVRDIEGQGSVTVLESDSLSVAGLRWSPDGLRLLIFGLIDGELQWLIVPRLGGQALSFNPYGFAAWSPEGSRLVGAWTPAKSLYYVDVESNQVVQTTELKGSFRWLIGIDCSQSTGLLLVVTKDDDDRYAIWTLSGNGDVQTKVFETETPIHSARWSFVLPEIYLLLGPSSGSELWKIRVAPETGEARGPATSVLSGVLGGGYFSVSREGVKLAYTKTASFSTIWRTDLEGLPGRTSSTSTRITSGTQLSGGFSVSPGGNWVALSRGDQTNSNIFLLSLQDDSMRQLTHLEGRNTSPVWSPDSSSVAFGSTHDGTPRVRRMSIRGGAAQLLDTGDVSTSLALEWAPGKDLLYQQPGNDRWGRLVIGSGDEKPLLSEELTESGWFFNPVYSPDGSKVALFANLGGRDVITIEVEETRRPATVLSSKTGARRGSFSQTLSAAGRRGQSIRLKAKVRVSGDEARARLFLKVRLENGETGFIETMRNRPISSTEWSEHEIVGLLDENANEIILGGWLDGAGAAWFDEFRLSIRDDGGEWQALPIENPGFEETSASEIPPGWRTLSPTATTFTITSEGPSPWGSALKIEALGATPAKGAFSPVDWSPDGKFVYLVDDPYEELSSTVIYRIPAEGGEVEEYLDLELAERLWWLDFSADGKFVVVETGRYQSDVWIARGFDPGLN